MNILTKNKKGHKFIILGIILALALGIVGCSSGDKEIVAKVNDDVITKDELYNLLVEQGGAQMLESLIAERIVDAEAKKAEVKITDEDVQKELDKMIEEAGGEDQFEQLMAYYGYNVEDMKKNISTNLKIKGLVGPDVEVTDADISEYFDENIANFTQEEEIKASHILVDTEEEANKIYDQLKDGGDFAELAKEHSKDGSASVGGDLGFFKRGKMVKEFSDVAFDLEIDEISKPVKSQFGYHIIKLVEKKEAKEANLEENKEKIKDIIFEDKMPTAYQSWYSKVSEDYKITNNLKKDK